MSGKSTIAALRDYFTDPPLEMAEIKALSKEERSELADLVFEATGWERMGAAS